MNETEKAVAAKLLTQILEANANDQQQKIVNYQIFVSAVECRTRAEERSPK